MQIVETLIRRHVWSGYVVFDYVKQKGRYAYMG